MSHSPLPDAIDPVAARDGDAVRPVEVGTALWAVTFVVLLFMQSTLRDNEALWWLWVPVVGVVTGLAGSVVARRRRRRIDQRTSGRA